MDMTLLLDCVVRSMLLLGCIHVAVHRNLASLCLLLVVTVTLDVVVSVVVLVSCCHLVHAR